MQLVAPDILAEAKGLSLGACGISIGVGLLLWLLGGRAHRFLTVLLTTLLAGLWGLHAAADYGVQPLVAALLLAIAAGVLSLALVRLVAFFAAGFATWVIVHALVPAWDDSLAFFVAGGLVGLLLFRLWMVVLTSLAGTLVMLYSALCLADTLGILSAVDVANDQAPVLNWAIAAGTVVGLVVQYLLDRYRAYRAGVAEQKEKERKEREAQYRRPRRRPWWGWGSNYRRAG
jgi:hypothetical protein